MTTNLTQFDLAFLATLAECRAMTIKQIAILRNQHPNAVRRRLKAIRGKGLITLSTRKSRSQQGRPEQIIRLTEEGNACAADTHKQIGQDHHWGPISCAMVEHQILQNWAYVQLMELAHRRNELSAEFRSPCPLEMGVGQSSHESLRVMPDAAFTISHQQKSLLFLLEVDMGSEPIASAQSQRACIAGKCRDYVDVYRRASYKQLEPVFNATFKGFRVLFLCNSSKRMRDICRFLTQAGNLDFCWVADEHHLLKEGMASPIWARGGDLHRPRHSILGNLADPLRSQ